MSGFPVTTVRTGASRRYPSLPGWRPSTPAQPACQQLDPVRSPGASCVEQLTNAGIRDVALRGQIGRYPPGKPGPFPLLDSRCRLPSVIPRVDPRIPERQRHSQIDQRRIITFRKRVLESVEPSTDCVEPSGLVCTGIRNEVASQCLAGSLRGERCQWPVRSTVLPVKFSVLRSFFGSARRYAVSIQI